MIKEKLDKKAAEVVMRMCRQHNDFVLCCCSQVKIIWQYLEIKGSKVHHLEQKAKTQHIIEHFRSIAVGRPTWRC